MVTGRPGTGKTTLAEAFLKESDLARVSASRIAASGLEAHDMLRAVAYAFGIDANALDKATLRRRIRQYLLQEKQSGRRALLIIDEAQGLPPASLEELRLLADLQEESQPLLQLFLVGQEQLRDMMSTPQMEQFQQRIIATCHLKPLDLWETRAYIKYRLRQAGWKGDPELSGAALLAIHAWSGGVPRQINKMCNRMLLLGYGKGKHVLDEEDTRTIYAELREERLTYEGSSKESASDLTTTRPLEKSTKGTFSLAELGVRWDQGDIESASATVTTAPAPSSDLPATTRQAQQTSVWRVHSKARTAREKQRQRVKPATTPANSVSAPVTLPHPGKTGLVGLSTERNRWRTGMAFVVIALASAGLIALGSMKLHLKERVEQKDSPREPQALIVPSLPRPDRQQGNAINRNPQTSGNEVLSQPLASTQEKPPDDGNRNPGNQNTIFTETSRTPATGEVSNKTADGAAPPLVPSETSTVLAHDGSEVAVVDTDGGGVTTTESNGAPANQELTDSVNTADMENQAILAASRPLASPRSREENIATLLARGQQALQQFKLLTPKGENAYDYFQQVLDLDRGNAEAQEGLDRIVDRYVTLVRRANAQQKTRLAKVYISRGLRVQPGNRELLALQDSVRKPPVIPVETVAAREPDVVAEPQQPTSLFSRIKSLFTWHRTQAAEVTDHSSTFAEP